MTTLHTWLYTMAATLAISLVSFAGAVVLAFSRRRLRSLTTYLVSLAVGGLLGGSFLHLIPVGLETFDDSNVVWLLVIAGFFASFLIEKFLGAHSHGHDEVPHQKIKPMVGVVLGGDAVHNFIDGIVIAAAFLLDPRVGVITTLIVMLHEIPQEFGDFGVLVSGGLSVRRALQWNFITATAGLLGAVLALLIGSRLTPFADVIMPIAAGNFIYIAGADLVPHLHQNESKASTTIMIGVSMLGVVLMLMVHQLSHILLPE